MPLPWDSLLASCDDRLRTSDIRDLLAVTSQPGVISFAGGLPAPELFPVDDLRVAFDAVLATDGQGALQYGPTEGYAPLREFLASRLRMRGIQAEPDTILLTTGSQQALDLIGKVFLRPRTDIVVEAPSYVGALQAFAAYDARFRAVPMDEQGMCTEHADRICRDAVVAGQKDRSRTLALLYTVPTFQNPSGVTMSRGRRDALIALSDRYQLPIVEDDPYGELRYDGDDVPPVRALPGGEETIYLGTFSKILSPGLRLGWVVAPRSVITRLVIAKQGADLHTDALVQRAVLHYCTHADLEGHIRRLNAVYGRRRDTMLAAMGQNFPASLRWTRPDGGLFLWVTMPDGVSSKSILADALHHHVAFVPGTAFYTDGGGAASMRLNFSHADPARIDEGIKRLGAVLTRHLSDATGAPVLQPSLR